MHTSYWRYINTLILPPDKNQPLSCQKKFWSYIKNIRRDRVGIISLQSDGNPITNSLGKAELLNEQFKSVFTIEPVGDLPNKGPSPYPTMPNITVTSQGIENLLNGLKTHKASGPDVLSATILKETSDIIAPIL